MQNREGAQIDPRTVTRFCRRHHIRLLSVIHRFDVSHPRARDWDMLVEFERGKSPGKFELLAIEIALTQLAGRRVDLRTLEELRPTTPRKLLDGATPVFVS